MTAVTDVDEVFQSYKKTIQSFKTVCDTLHDISSYLNNAVQRMEAIMQPFILSHSFGILPDDVLARVFELVDPVETPPNVLASVCRRFRNIMLHLPRLWTHISTVSSTRNISDRLERSKEMGLDVEAVIDRMSSKRDISSKLDLLIHHAWRWRSLLLQFDDDRVGLPLLPASEDTWKAVQLPMLHQLTIYRSRYPRPTHIGENYDVPLVTDWDMPKLRSLKLTNIFPHHKSNSSLRSFSIKLRSMSSTIRFSRHAYEQLQFFLQTSVQLEEITLDFVFAIFGRFVEHEPIHLPNLRALTFLLVVNYDFVGHDLAPMVNLINTLKTPNLDRLTICLGHLRSFDAILALTRFFTGRQNDTDLRVLELEIAALNDSYTDIDILQLIFTLLPQVEHVTLKGTFGSFVIPESWAIGNHRRVNLRTLTLYNFTSSNRKVAHELRHLFVDADGEKSTATFPHFEKVIFSGCLPDDSYQQYDPDVGGRFFEWL